MTYPAKPRRWNHRPSGPALLDTTDGALRRVRRAAQVGITNAGSPDPFHLELLESRVLLSNYSLSQIGYFGANATGASPQSTMVADASGNLYGTTTNGGAYGAGAVFELANGSNQITVLASFDGYGDGSDPDAGLTLDAAGNIFGKTETGGWSGAGNVFEIAKGSNAITTLVEFSAKTIPGSGSLAVDTSGNVYGTTQRDGASGANVGSIF